MASTYLSRTPSSSGNLKTWTFSAWFKKGSGGYLLGVADMTDGDPGTNVEAGTAVLFSIYNGGYVSRLDPLNLTRDVSGWYHYVVSVDTTQATASDRVKIYLNGERITSFSTETYPPQNYDTMVNSSSYEHRIGDRGGGSFDGSMAHVHLIDGTAYPASTFGEYSATSGVWKPKTAPSVTYGTNGFFLKFANSAALGTDSSGNSNNFTVNGTGTQTLDTPSNVFATLNPLGSTVPPATVGYTLSNGNTTAQYTDAANANFTPATLATMSGKWYVECKVSADGSFGGDWPEIGVLYADNISNIQQTNTGAHNTGVMVNTANIVANGNKYDFGTASLSYFSGFTNNDIISMAMDCNTGKIWFGVNGTWINSGDPANGTGENATATTNKFLTFYSRWYQPSTTLIKWNFGNGYFGTTAVSTPESDGDGFGKFEYAVPTGFYSLCTKNIITYG